MKFIQLPLSVLVLVAYANAACTDIDNCNSCSNPPLQCYTCPSGQALKKDQTGCLECPANCLDCISTDDDETSCLTCDIGYIREEDGTCTECGAGCTSCEYSVDDNIVCTACDIHYVLDPENEECAQCPSYCKTCSLNDDGTVECSACYNMQEHGTRAYYLKASDKKCKACPSYCEECADSGSGTGICKKCKSGYNLLEDPEDSDKDGTKCLKCPADCDSCSGIQNGAAASCTSCKADLGLWVDSDDCWYCDSDTDKTACKNCDDEGDCSECNEGWRLDEGSCVECPTFCLSCSVDESTGDDICDTCDLGYGDKSIESITCDACPSNCASCTLANDGALSCSTCDAGYAKNGDGKCTACASGCATCHWESSDDYMSCDTCKTGYTDSPITPDGGAESSSNIGVCKSCPTNCDACPDEDNCASTSDCDDGYVIVTDNNGDDKCEAVTANCAIASDNGTTNCDTCDDGYYQDADGECSTCPSGLNCMTCDTSGNAECDSCPESYAFVDADFDNVTDSCEPCGISQCTNCHAIGDYAGNTKKCFTCATGYALYDKDDSTSNGYEQCKKCPSGCDTCTIDTSDNDKTKCSNGGCQAWDTKKAYTNGEDGACEVCPSNCQQCTWDSSEEVTKCDANQCETGYTKNEDDGECNECPDNCDSCEWDDSTSSVICSTGGCETGYGLTDESLCEACPSNCDSCTYDTTLEILICGTCSSGFRSNSDVCASCPSNCQVCSESDGSMICSACNEGYALRSSDKVCVKCPSHCEECDAKSTTVTCKTCKIGYGVAADKLSCIACRDAAFDNCNTCSNVDATTEKATCTSCTSGYILKDDASSCLDTSNLNCPGGYEDRYAMCSECSNNYEISSDKSKCQQQCIVCGDIKEGTYADVEDCKTYGNVSIVESCDEGSCWGYFKTVDGVKKFMAGCEAKACSGDASLGETCSKSDDDKCSQCCTGDRCNVFVTLMDGSTDSAVVPGVSMLGIMLPVLMIIMM